MLRSVKRFGSLVAIAGVGLQGCTLVQPQTGENPPTLIAPASPETTLPADGEDIVKVVNQVGPAVVRINASRTVGNRSAPFFPSVPQDRIEQGTGSGFIFDANGLILTNAHVVDRADQVVVVLKDGQQFQGKVLGADPLTDIAVVQIEANNLPVAELGNSDTLLPGQWVIAIGNPLGLDNTVTVGIISATGRSSKDVGSPDQRVNFIQTDAAINPGNSGGPLLDLQGKVIGVNTAIIRGAQGLGFAIPVVLAQRIAQQIISTGKAQHAYLGIEMANVTPKLRDRLKQAQSDLKIPDEDGVLVVEIVPNSPAQTAQMKKGDLIIQLDNRPIKNSEQLQQVVADKVPGDVLKIEVKRGTQTQVLTVKMGTLTPSTFNREG
ncbi:MAG: trypsin-like peptidase domain-containing protein [Thermosynechococcaceae cyanobacterium]